MENDDRLRRGDPRYDEAMALEMTVRATRHAQGKKNPEDFPRGYPEWDTAYGGFTREIYRGAMGGDPADLE